MTSRGSTLLIGCVAIAVAAAMAVGAWWTTRPPPIPPPESVRFDPVDYGDLAGWNSGDHAAALAPLIASCAVLSRQPTERSIGGNGAAGTVGDWQPACAAATAVDAQDPRAARAYFERWFAPYALRDGTGARNGLFTGYYEAELHGSRVRSAAFDTPLHARPPDLVMVDLGAFRKSLAGERIAGSVESGRLRPYPSRGEIIDGALEGRGTVLLWVDDPVDAFFLHIQGSGRVLLDDGSVVRLGYDGQNGHPYLAIGRPMIEQGMLDRAQVSMQTIRAWLDANADQARDIMDLNASYVFFRELAGDGPLGAQGVALTPGRSLAVDRRFLPLSAPIWLDTEAPGGDGARLRRLMIAQDTGGAIRGAVRGDVFWGYGTEAAEIAGRMKARGTATILVPRTVTVGAGDP